MKPRRRQEEPSSATIRFWAKMIASAVAVLLITVWETVQAQHYQKELTSMKREADRLTYENARMQMQIHQWESPSHLDLVAREDLKMGPIDSKHIIAIETK